MVDNITFARERAIEFKASCPLIIGINSSLRVELSHLSASHKAPLLNNVAINVKP
jgi:hypothetical protein